MSAGGTPWARRGQRVLRVEVLSGSRIDVGVGLVLRTTPLVLVVPAHLATNLSLGEATGCRVQGEDLGLPTIVHAPSAAQDELTLLRFAKPLRGATRTLRVPLRRVGLSLGRGVSLVLPDLQGARSVQGRVTALKLEHGQEWIESDLPCAPGASGGALFAGRTWAGVCQAMTAPKAEQESASALAIRLSRATIAELARESGRRPLRVAIPVAAAALIVTLGAGLAFLHEIPGIGRAGKTPAPASPAAISELRALYVYGSGSTNPALMGEKLQSAGFHVDAAAIAPVDLGYYSLVVAHVNAVAPDRLKTFVQEGGGLVMLEATPYYLGVSDIASWLGADKYVNAAVCVHARIAMDRPMETEFRIGDIVAKSACAWEGAAAMTDLHPDALVFARWEDPDCAFAFGHRFGDGRVYYQAQFGGAYVGEDAWTLFLAGARWATGLTR